MKIGSKKKSKLKITRGIPGIHGMDLSDLNFCKGTKKLPHVALNYEGDKCPICSLPK